MESKGRDRGTSSNKCAADSCASNCVSETHIWHSFFHQLPSQNTHCTLSVIIPLSSECRHRRCIQRSVSLNCRSTRSIQRWDKVFSFVTDFAVLQGEKLQHVLNVFQSYKHTRKLCSEQSAPRWNATCTEGFCTNRYLFLFQSNFVFSCMFWLFGCAIFLCKELLWFLRFATKRETCIQKKAIPRFAASWLEKTQVINRSIRRTTGELKPAVTPANYHFVLVYSPQ